MPSVGAAAGASARREERWRQTLVLLCVVTTVPCVEGMSSDDAKVEVVVTLSITFLVSPPHTCTVASARTACHANNAVAYWQTVGVVCPLLLTFICMLCARHCCSHGQFVAHTPCTAAPMASSLHTRHALLLSWPAPRAAHLLPCISVVNYVVAAMHIHTSQFTQCTDRCSCCCCSSCCCCCHARVHTCAKILLVGSIAAIVHTRQLSSSAASSSGSKHDRGRSERSSARPVTLEAPGASAQTTGDGGVHDDDDDE